MLSKNFEDCPKSWQNFIDTINENPGVDVPLNTIQSRLSTYGATLLDDDVAVEFVDEQHLFLFTLAWS